MYPAMENAFFHSRFFENSLQNIKKRLDTSCSFSCEYNDIYPTFWVSS